VQAKHSARQHTWGVDGDGGKLADMQEYGVWEPQVVKTQSIKTAIESACLLLRVDDVVSGIRKRDKSGPGVSRPMEDAAPMQGDGPNE
jgi:T-complex protein 1 subunit gamma